MSNCKPTTTTQKNYFSRQLGALPSENPTEIPSNAELEQFETYSLEDMGISLDSTIMDPSMPTKQDLESILTDIINNNEFPDMYITVGQTQYECHQTLLRCFSELCREYSITEDKIVLDSEDMNELVFEATYEWMRNETHTKGQTNVLLALQGARFFRIPSLQEQCWSYIQAPGRFYEENAFRLYIEANRMNVECVKGVLISRINKSFLVLVAVKEFLELNYQEVSFLLSTSNIAVNNEIEVFMSGLRWLKHDWNNRKMYITEIMSSVRFALLPKWFLVHLQTTTGCDYLDELTQTESVKHMIHDSVTTLTASQIFQDSTDQQTTFLERYNLSLPKNRDWIMDNKCPYHHSIKCQSIHFITYKQFCTYLDAIIKAGCDYWKNFKDDETHRNGQCKNQLCSFKCEDKIQILGIQPSGTD